MVTTSGSISGAQLRERAESGHRRVDRGQVHLPGQRQGLPGGDGLGRDLHEGTAENFQEGSYSGDCERLVQGLRNFTDYGKGENLRINFLFKHFSLS